MSNTDMNIVRMIPALVLLAAALPLAARDIAYRWVDEQGVTHFSDTPPAGAERVRELAIPDYKPPAGPAFSYVAMLRRLQALERELDEARRENGRRATPAPVVVQPVHTVERAATPVFFPHRPGFRPVPPRPGNPVRQSSTDRFDRLVEGTRDRYQLPRR